MTTRVYLAAPLGDRARMRAIASRERTWMECTSRWLDPEWTKPQGRDPAVHQAQMAEGDLADIERSDVVVVFAARHGWGHAVELGYAVARRKPVIVIEPGGDFFSTFHFLPGVERYKTWEDARLLVRDEDWDARRGDSQPLPIPNDGEDVQTRVMRDVMARREVGIERYGTALQTFNGRDALQDLYEELIDGVMYVRQRLDEDREILPVVAHLWSCPLEPYACFDPLHGRARQLVQTMPREVPQ